MKPQISVSRHPLVLHDLARLRHRETPPQEFRRLVGRLSQLLFWEAANELRLEPVTIATPLADCPSLEIRERIGLLPILRAGLGMAEAIQDCYPQASVWHLGLYRDHNTLKPVTYYEKLPNKLPVDVAFVLDPMLATGGSAIAALDLVKRTGAKRIYFLSLIAAPEGVATLHRVHPDVPLYTAAVDQCLNDDSYIVPGLGDAGDRQFDTA